MLALCREDCTCPWKAEQHGCLQKHVPCPVHPPVYALCMAWLEGFPTPLIPLRMCMLLKCTVTSIFINIGTSAQSCSFDKAVDLAGVSLFIAQNIVKDVALLAQVVSLAA